VHKNQIHVSDSEMEALATTAAVGGFAVEEAVGAAIGAFAGQEEAFKENYLRATWLAPQTTRSCRGRDPNSRGEGSVPWHIVSFPSTAKSLLRKHRKEDFSPVQKIRAAIQFYAALPLHCRIQLAREYTAQCQAKQDKS
jgi:hypothetical protein